LNHQRKTGREKQKVPGSRVDGLHAYVVSHFILGVGGNPGSSTACWEGLETCDSIPSLFSEKDGSTVGFSKRRMLFLPEVNPKSFVFFYDRGSSGTSWSIRDYSIRNRVKKYSPHDFRHWSADGSGSV
jgi:hypothetical protein